MAQVYKAGSNILIDRGNRENAIAAMQKVGERMKKDNLSVAIFVEGFLLIHNLQIDTECFRYKVGSKR